MSVITRIKCYLLAELKVDPAKKTKRAKATETAFQDSYNIALYGRKLPTVTAEQFRRQMELDKVLI